MRFVKVILCFLTLVLAQDVFSQCDSCDALNANGDFEIQNDIPGSSHDLGISLGEIDNWYATHGTADYFDAEWNWYYTEGIESNAAHICYGNRPTHDHSEGIFTKVDIKGNKDIDFCLDLSLGSFCNKEKHGRLHIYLANNLEKGGTNGFSFPSPVSQPEMFENADLLDIIDLDEETYYEDNGWSHFNVAFNTEKNYSQLWIFTEFLHPEIDFANCGVMIDDVKVTAKTKKLKGIETEEHSPSTFSFLPIVEGGLNDLTYDWDFGNGQSSTEKNPTISFDEGLYDVTLKIKTNEGACAIQSTQIKAGDFITNELCSYKVCLSSNGVPAIANIEIELPDGYVMQLDETTPGFGFPYCVGTWSVCNNGEYELEYLLHDLNTWMSKNEYKGRAIINEDKIDDGCRADLFSIVETDLNFVSVTMGYEDDEDRLTEMGFDVLGCVLEIADPKDDLQQNEITEIEIDIYPNPTVERISITLSDMSQNATVGLYDFHGKKLQEQILNETSVNTTQMNLESLSPGTYYVQVLVDSKVKMIPVLRL